jgi:hypothetical protein
MGDADFALIAGDDVDAYLDAVADERRERERRLAVEEQAERRQEQQTAWKGAGW